VPTPRKRYAIIECSLLREEWSDAAKLACVQLLLLMAERSAADLLKPEEANHIRLSPGDLRTITSRSDVAEARAVLDEFAAECSIEMSTTRAGWIALHWPKVAETQGWGARSRGRIRALAGNESGESRPEKGRSQPEKNPSSAPPSGLRPPASSSGLRPPKDTEKSAPSAPVSAEGVETRKPEEEAWELLLAAAALYRNGKRPDWKLDDVRRRSVLALMKAEPKRGVAVVAQLAHGYRYARRKWDDVDEFFEPKTLLRPSHRAAYLEKYDTARAGGPPPYPAEPQVARPTDIDKPKTTRHVATAEETRADRERVRQEAERAPKEPCSTGCGAPSDTVFHRKVFCTPCAVKAAAETKGAA
jgi:hypothetical protein